VRRLLVFVCAIVLVDTALYAALVPLLSEYSEEFGLSKAAAGLLVGAYAGGALIGALPGGIAASRFGPKRAVLAGLVLMGLASVGFGFADGAWALGVARLVQGFGSALSWAGGLTWLIAASPRHRRGEVLGTAIGSAIFGALLGPAIGAATEVAGARPVFSALAGVSAALVVWALRTPGAEADRQPFRLLVAALRDNTVLGALGLMSLPALFFGVLAVLVPLELGDAGWRPAAIGALFISSAALEMFVSPVIGRLSDRHGRLLPVRFALAAAVCVSVALAFADRPLVLAPLTVVAGVSWGAFWAPAMALLSDGAERVGLAQGLAFGLMNGAWAVGNVVGPAAGGALGQVAGDALPYALMAALCAATALVVAAFGSEDARVPESP
jgi:MFS family permease